LIYNEVFKIKKYFKQPNRHFYLMMNEHLLIQIVLLLAIAVMTVSISRRLHFPPILGYIIVGVIVGPNGFGFIDKAENIELLAEFGIVFLLFAIGLEFSYWTMIAMRRH
jgi:Kef-type potassium/proton antiporter, CPA2 family (TC 2.A.37.1)